MAEVTAKIGKDGAPVTANYPLLDATTLKQLADNFGEAVAVAHCKSSITVALQSYLRSLQKQGKKGAEVQRLVSEWKPGMRTPGKSRLEKAEDLVGKMSDEEKRNLIKKLQGKA